VAGVSIVIGTPGRYARNGKRQCLIVLRPIRFNLPSHASSSDAALVECNGAMVICDTVHYPDGDPNLTPAC
jgi:hypothetical protein